eukprot:gnl/Spiro4/10765_TR5733_c0_g1_i1.p1 gnl/Spiro4/10765_TR5733_c0_g1~~gnl/Spiro4/10765_TR5733_c0_g1_i1.p1  ORF type:complete len:372 (-),score=140.21 gnl/Spiro4/10765_TR5733_c0_g1_i1:214-1293(-)
MSDSSSYSSYSASASSEDEFSNPKKHAKAQQANNSRPPAHHGEILRELETHQTGVHSQIADMYEHRSSQLESVKQQIHAISNQIKSATEEIQAKDQKIMELTNELRNLDANRPKYEAKDRAISEKVHALRQKLNSQDHQHRSIVDETMKMDHDMRNHHERIVVYEQQIARCRQYLQELEARLDSSHTDVVHKDKELEEQRQILAEVRQHNHRLHSEMRAREADLAAARREFEKSQLVHRHIHDKDEEIRELLKSQFEIARKYEEHKLHMREKDAEQQALAAEVRQFKNLYLNAKKANSTLMKRLILLARDPKQDQGDSDESDEELSNLRIQLQQRSSQLGTLFKEQQENYERLHGLARV